MKKITNMLKLGATAPFTVLHASDTHLTYADERDDKRKIKLAEARLPVFPDAEENLRELTEMAKDCRLTVMHTGDLLDFVSAANIDAARAFTDEVDCFMAAGNHEFSLYVGEAREDAAYRNISLDRVNAAFKNDIRFASRVINGINFVALDNGYYLVEEWQLARLKAEVEKGLPVVLLVHTPLYSEETLAYLRERGAANPAYLMSVPEELMREYTPDRYEQQLQDETTKEAYEYITNCAGIRAILAGHLHADFEADVTPGLRQYVTDIGTVREVTIE